MPHHQLLLLRADLGSVVLPWGSLATLLWADRCRAKRGAGRLRFATPSSSWCRSYSP